MNKVLSPSLIVLTIVLGAFRVAEAGTAPPAACPAGLPASPRPAPDWVPTADCLGWVPLNHPLASPGPTTPPPLPAECTVATLRGNYGIQIQGTRPAPGGLTESVIGVVLRTYDGQGNFSQVSNLKGSIIGTNPDSQSVGTYEVNPDCTGIIRSQPLPGLLLEERLVIVDNGREIRAAVMVPTAVVITSVHLRIR